MAGLHSIGGLNRHTLPETRDYTQASGAARWQHAQSCVPASPCRRWFPVFAPSIVARVCVPYSRGRMRDKTETLAVGDQAPEFTLPAANRDGPFPLRTLLAGGPLVLEFLRGTWW